MKSTFIINYDVAVVDSSVSFPVMSSFMKSSERQPHLQLPRGMRVEEILNKSQLLIYKDLTTRKCGYLV